MQLCSHVLGSRTRTGFLGIVFTALPQARDKDAHHRRLVGVELRALT